MSFYDKSDLYFYDYNLAGLFVQENYLAVTPQVRRVNQGQTVPLGAKILTNKNTYKQTIEQTEKRLNWQKIREKVHPKFFNGWLQTSGLKL